MSTKSKKPPVTSPSQPSHSTPSGRPAKDPSGVAYIFPDGRVIAVDDADAMFTALAAKESDPEALKRLLWGLARECDESGKHDGAAAYLEKVLTLEEDPEARAHCFLTMGQLFERKEGLRGGGRGLLAGVRGAGAGERHVVLAEQQPRLQPQPGRPPRRGRGVLPRGDRDRPLPVQRIQEPRCQPARAGELPRGGS